MTTRAGIELRIECMLPADEATAELCRRLAEKAAEGDGMRAVD